MILSLTTRPRAALSEDDAPAVFCLPFAGGGASSYRTWRRALGDSATVYALELPGHETAQVQSCLTDREALIHAVTECIALHAGRRPYVIYGHSFGGILAFHVIPRLLALGRPPRRLVVGACRPPGDPPVVYEVERYDDDTLLATLRDELEHGETARTAFLADLEVRKLFLPPLRADLDIDGNIRTLPGAPLEVEVVAISGSDDPWAGAAVMRGWSDWSAAGFHHETLTGGHFFAPVLGQSPERLRALLFDPIPIAGRRRRSGPVNEDVRRAGVE